MTKRIGVVAVFLVGCAVGGVGGQLAVPKASAQQAATLTKWEYHCRFYNFGSVEEFNSLGAEAWELASVAGHENSIRTSKEYYCFKRPKL